MKNKRTELKHALESFKQADKAEKRTSDLEGSTFGSMHSEEEKTREGQD